jgi:hypothetical protein
MRKFIATLGIAVTCAVATPTMAQTQVAAVPLVQSWQGFADPQEAAFSADVPGGWKVQGGTVRRNALQFRNYLNVTSPDGSTILAVNDPNEWAYVVPTQMLSMAGFREGSIYGGGGGTLYTVASYRNGAQFSAAWGQKRLANLCRDVRVEGSRERPDLSGQINVYSSAYKLHHDIGEASFTCVNAQGQPMTAYVMTSVLSIGDQRGAIWYAESIVALLSPTAVAGVAAGELAHIIGSIQVNPIWMARQTQTNMDVSNIMTRTSHAISDSIMGSWQDRGAVIDRVMEAGSRARLGIEVYESPATGDKHTVSNKYQYNWINPQGVIVGTNTDTPPNGFSRLQLVPPR